MSSAIKYKDYICWGTTGAIEDAIQRSQTIALNLYGHEHPVTSYLGEVSSMFWSGTVVDLDPLSTHLSLLATLIDQARVEALNSGEFTDVGIQWLTAEFADFCNLLQGMKGAALC